ncbi:MAG: hypothetical protein RLZZ436_704 [Planctomycetota bacterium]|jgi:hypothetical protein
MLSLTGTVPGFLEARGDKLGTVLDQARELEETVALELLQAEFAVFALRAVKSEQSSACLQLL